MDTGWVRETRPYCHPTHYDIFASPCDGGLETTLIFHEGLDLPEFASFVLMATPDGREHLKNYYNRYLQIARQNVTGFILDTPTWRANPDWGTKLGYGSEAFGRDQKAFCRSAAEPSKRIRIGRNALRHQRRHRATRRRLQGRRYERRGGGKLSCRADRYLCADQSRHGCGLHADQLQRGDRDCPRGKGTCHALCDLVHGRNRWKAGDRPGAGGTRSTGWTMQPVGHRPIT
jgi:hypothetical protein